VTAVIFDMGGVLIELGPVSEILGDSASLAVDDFWSAWLHSESVRAFESGKIEAAEFALGIIAEVGLKVEPAALLESFASWPKGLFPGAETLVADVGRVAVTGLLSNTNRLHWEGQRDAEIMRSLFDREYLSFMVGLVKPDADIFEYIVQDLDRPADEILFLDDNQINVDGARAVGLQAELTLGPAEARAAVARHGLAVGGAESS